jgi:hypothetical protein
MENFSFLRNNMETKYRICISSPPDRDKLVAEIFFGECQWAELNQESAEPQLEFYARPDGKPWNISLLAALEALKAAKERLIG